jgi:hypothetical protein
LVLGRALGRSAVAQSKPKNAKHMSFRDELRQGAGHWICVGRGTAPRWRGSWFRTEPRFATLNALFGLCSADAVAGHFPRISRASPFRADRTHRGSKDRTPDAAPPRRGDQG